MKKIFALLGICLIAQTIPCFSQTAASKLTAHEKAYIVSRFSTELKYNFAFYNDLDFDPDSLCRAYMPALAATTSDDDFVKGMQALCARFHDGHTFIFTMNDPDNKADWIRPLPMKTKRVGDRVFVTDVFSSVFQKPGVNPGCEILKIDGMNVLEYAGRHIQPYLASSTPQWTKYRPFAEFELTKDKGTKVSRIVFRDKKGKEFTVESNRLIPWDLSSNSATIDLDVLKGNVGLLTVRSFQDSDFNRSFFDELYNEILKTDALIIDIRGNSGGNSSHADYMIRHFCNKPVPQGKWSTPMYIAAHGSWNYPPEWYMQTPGPIYPVYGKEIYQKPVVLLVDATTFSSAENFCVSFKGAKRGKIIGSPTGGSTGNPVLIELGGGLACCICTKHELDADGNEFIGIGIIPDILVEEDLDYYLKNKDNIIEKALEILKER